jgi:hypothetical protein
MKVYCLLFLCVALVSCNNNTSTTDDAVDKSTSDLTPNAPDSHNDSLTTDYINVEQRQATTQINKKENFLIKPDDRAALKDRVQSRRVFKETEDYILDYTYPYLDEKVDPYYKNFNDYMRVNHLNEERTIGEILETTGMISDTLNIQRFSEKRIIDFKIHSTSHKLISILLYKENYYAGMVNSMYMFECLNYDVNKQAFVGFDDFFISTVQPQVLNIINKSIQSEINSGMMYYDCWQITDEDFDRLKDNFVVNEDSIEFYFDDYIICPSYTGQYSVSIPLASIKHLITKHQKSLLTFNN